jgi:predicted NBD/HSP70 family sugar kinase
MKESNRMSILNLLRKRSMSRVELSRETGLTRAAITLIVDKLLEDKLVVEASVEDSGRKSVLLQINETSFYAMGLDIARDHCYLGAMTIGGKLLAKECISIEKTKYADEALEIIVDNINRMQKTVDTNGKFLGLGITAPGPMDIKSGTILNPPNFYKWHNVGIVKHLKEALGYSVFLDNDAIAQTLTEKYYGSVTAYHNYLIMMINTGIGAGIILNDQLYRGVNGFGNEIGHITIDYKGRPCDCGNTGCLELYAGINAVLGDPALNGSNVKSWEEIVDGAMEGNEKLIQVIKNEAEYLSTAITTCMNMLEFEAIIIKGMVCYRPDMLLDEIKKIVWNQTITRNYRSKVPVMVSPDIKDNEVIAAATIVIDKFFNNDIDVN